MVLTEVKAEDGYSIATMMDGVRLKVEGTAEGLAITMPEGYTYDGYPVAIRLNQGKVPGIWE